MGTSHGFSLVAVETCVIFSSYSGDGPSKLMFVEQSQDSCLVTIDISGLSLRLGRATGTLLEVRRETEVLFPVAKVILGFLSIFKTCQAPSPFEALNSVCLTICYRDVRPPVVMWRGPRAFSRVSTGDSDILSSCEMKDEPVFKQLQGNPAFFRVRASRCPFHLRQQPQGPSHIPIAVRSLLLQWLWKIGLPLESKPGNQLSSRDDLGYMTLSSSCCAELGLPLDLGWGSRGIS